MQIEVHVTGHWDRITETLPGDDGLVRVVKGLRKFSASSSRIVSIGVRLTITQRFLKVRVR